jgi:hypothetical protein
MKDKDVRKRRLNLSYRKLITTCLSKQSTHFRSELNGDEVKIFIDKLAPWSDYQITAAFERCLTECMFFPKLKEVLDRMPERREGHTKTCPVCEPDGWRLIISPTAGPPYRAAVRCDHSPDNPPNPSLDDLKQLYVPSDVPQNAAAPLRWPHLVGKGIIHGQPS